MNLGDALSSSVGLTLTLITVLVGAATLVTVIARGTQQARVSNLTEVNDDLRKERTDLEGRAARTKADLAAMTERCTAAETAAAESELERQKLQVRVDLMQDVVERVVEPIQKLEESAVRNHREEMAGQELISSMLIDLLHMRGDMRNRFTVAEAMRAPRREDETDGA